MKRFLIVMAVLALLLVILWRSREAPSPPVADAPRLVQAPAASPDLPEPLPMVPPATTPPVESVASPEIPPAERQRVLDAIDNLEFVFRDHAAALGGNPVGTNAEITAALLGDNAKQLRLDVPGGSSVNARGELCDPWGTPWFFHQISGTKMEIRSAGPDRVLYTADDFMR